MRMADGTEFETPLLVNSASLHACALARRFEGLDPAIRITAGHRELECIRPDIHRRQHKAIPLHAFLPSG